MGVCPIPRALHRQRGLDATRLYSYGIYIAIAHVVTAHTVMAYVVMADGKRVWMRRAVSDRFHVGPPTRRTLAAGMVTKKKRSSASVLAGYVRSLDVSNCRARSSNILVILVMAT